MQYTIHVESPYNLYLLSLLELNMVSIESAAVFPESISQVHKMHEMLELDSTWNMSLRPVCITFDTLYKATSSPN